jgi:hypothetical protein
MRAADKVLEAPLIFHHFGGCRQSAATPGAIPANFSSVRQHFDYTNSAQPRFAKLLMGPCKKGLILVNCFVPSIRLLDHCFRSVLAPQAIPRFA